MVMSSRRVTASLVSKPVGTWWVRSGLRGDLRGGVSWDVLQNEAGSSSRAQKQRGGGRYKDGGGRQTCRRHGLITNGTGEGTTITKRCGAGGRPASMLWPWGGALMGKLQHHPDRCESRAGPDAVWSSTEATQRPGGESDLHHDGRANEKKRRPTRRMSYKTGRVAREAGSGMPTRKTGDVCSGRSTTRLRANKGGKGVAVGRSEGGRNGGCLGRLRDCSVIRHAIMPNAESRNGRAAGRRCDCSSRDHQRLELCRRKLRVATGSLWQWTGTPSSPSLWRAEPWFYLAAPTRAVCTKADGHDVVRGPGPKIDALALAQDAR